jgi:release factor glutamine methyltransferase
VILFNAPYLPTEATESISCIGHAWEGGTTGRKIIDRFVPEAPKHLKWRGRILLMQSTLANVNETFHKFAERRMKAGIVAECAAPFFETITLLRAMHSV